MNLQQNVMMTSEEIYEDLCLKIEKLEYMPGERLSENDLSKTYNVTRHVIRNALASLKQRKLVDVFPQRGTYVSLIDMDYIEDILYMREAMEQEALCRIMKIQDCSSIVTTLKQIVEKQKNIIGETDFGEAYYVLDNEFHLTLLKAVGKPNVMNLISESYIHIRRWRNYEIRSERRIQEIISEHENLICAIEQKDAQKGRESLHLHLDTVNRYSKPLKEKEARYFVQK